MTEKVKVGFVGCGGIAEAHMKGLVKNLKAALVAFCDIRLKRAEEMARKYGATDSQVFTDAKKMFDRVELNAAYFCLPPFAHGAEMEAVKHKVPFFVEKPINLYLDQAEKITAAVKKEGMITSVGYMNRYRRGVKKVRELLREDPPILVLGGWIGGTPHPSPERTILYWWIIKEKSGGQFHEQVTHTVDLARFLCGEVAKVQAYPAEGINKEVPNGYNIEDASVVNLKFVNGAVGSLWASCSADGGGGGVSLSIYANKTTALFTGWEHSLRLLRVDEEPKEIPGEPDIFALEDAAFIEAAHARDPSKIMCPYADGVETLKVTLAANRSMETGQPVRLHRR